MLILPLLQSGLSIFSCIEFGFAKLAESKPLPEDEKPPKSGGVLGLAILATVAIASSFGWNILILEKPSAERLSCPNVNAPEVLARAAKQKGEDSYTLLPEILITVGSTPAERYLKLTVAVATPKGKDNAVKDAELLLTDAFNTYLRSIEITDFEDPEFYSHMRDQLAWRAEIVLGNSVAKGVLITEFLLR